MTNESERARGGAEPDPGPRGHQLHQGREAKPTKKPG